MKLLILCTLLFSSCQHPNPAALQGYLNYMQKEQHHRDRMKATNRLPMRPIMQQTTPNPYDPMQMQHNPYAPSMGGY